MQSFLEKLILSKWLREGFEDMNTLFLKKFAVLFPGKSKVEAAGAEEEVLPKNEESAEGFCHAKQAGVECPLTLGTDEAVRRFKLRSIGRAQVSR